MRNTNNFWRLNERILAQSLRVLDSEGKQIGIMPKSEALAKAKAESKDLVEVVPNASPPVAKIIEFGKFKYQEEKKQRQIQKRSKPSELKELRFTPFIGEADYQTRLRRMDEFLKEKNKVKLSVYFKLRQLGSKRFGYDIFERVLKDLGEGINIDMKPKFLGRNLLMIISPTSLYGKAKKDEQNENKTTDN